MNKYEEPEMSVIQLSASDVIASSGGINLPEVPIYGNW